MTQGKCDVCGKFKELEPPRKKLLNVPDDYLMLCLQCRAKVGARSAVSTHGEKHAKK